MPGEIVTSFIRSIERRDLPAALDHLSADVECDNVPMGKVQGRAAVEAVLGPFIAKRRAPKVRKLYDAIGGGSPILHWTRAQGEGLCARLDALSPETAPHRFYVAFRYVEPSADAAVRQMAADGVTRAIASILSTTSWGVGT